MVRNQTNELVHRECKNPTCGVWFCCSDFLNQQQYCSKYCKRLCAERRHNANRRKRGK